jgi:hypothetical protein
MVDREIVQPEFFATSTAEGTEKQKADAALAIRTG